MAVDLILNGESKKCGPGDVVTIEPGTKHAFVQNLDV